MVSRDQDGISWGAEPRRSESGDKDGQVLLGVPTDTERFGRTHIYPTLDAACMAAGERGLSDVGEITYLDRSPRIVYYVLAPGNASEVGELLKDFNASMDALESEKVPLDNESVPATATERPTTSRLSRLGRFLLACPRVYVGALQEP